MLRVIAGAYKGRRLASPPGTSTRPTSGRVREALFSMLGNLDGLKVLDLFAGSGALGIEALSRGAAEATFVDADRVAAACIRENLSAVGRSERVIEADWAKALERLASGGAGFDIVFVDPPYGQTESIAAELARELPSVIVPGSLVVTESNRSNPLDLKMIVKRERVYGGTLLRIHEHE